MRQDVFDEPNDGMEAPCQCDCGKWFDLDDGLRSAKREGAIICSDCQLVEQTEIEKEEEIQELREEIADLEHSLKHAKDRLAELLKTPTP